MNYAWVRDATLKLMNQYTITGVEIGRTYNNQADYLIRIPSLVNAAMVEIATTVKRIQATMRMRDLRHEEFGDYIRYELPSGFYQFKSGSMLRTVDGKLLHSNTYQMQDRKFILIPKDEDGDYYVTYYRYPILLSETPNDADPLDNTIETQMAIPYYVASYLVDDDDAFRCALYRNTFADKLANMTEGVSIDVRPVDDVYDGQYTL